MKALILILFCFLLMYCTKEELPVNKNTFNGKLAMGLRLLIKRETPISIEEWKGALSRVEGIRLKKGNWEITNPQTKEVISLPNSGADADLYFPDRDAWQSVFRYRNHSKDITFNYTKDWEDKESILHKKVSELLKLLNATVVYY